MTHLNTGTAADILKFDTHHHTDAHVDRLTRAPTASQEFIVTAAGNERYIIKFDKNFSKKHLFTFSKKADKTSHQATLESQKPGQAGQDAQNWHNAEMELLKGKIAKNLDRRAVADTCSCTHRFNRHPGGGACNHVRGHGTPVSPIQDPVSSGSRVGPENRPRSGERRDDEQK